MTRPQAWMVVVDFFLIMACAYVWMVMVPEGKRPVSAVTVVPSSVPARVKTGSGPADKKTLPTYRPVQKTKKPYPKRTTHKATARPVRPSEVPSSHVPDVVLTVPSSAGSTSPVTSIPVTVVPTVPVTVVPEVPEEVEVPMVGTETPQPEASQ